jgi:hypothetical protein
VHERQAGVAADDDVVDVFFVEHGCQKALRLGQPVEHAVVAAVDAVFGVAVLERVHAGQHRHAQIKLRAGRFAARHVERQVAPLDLGVVVFKIPLERLEFGVL